MRPVPGDADDEGVHRLGQAGTAAGNPAEERLGVCLRERPSERPERGQTAALSGHHLLSEEVRQEGQRCANRRAGEALDRLVRARITPVATGQPGKIEGERDAGDRDPLGECRLQAEPEGPRGRARRLEQRVDLRDSADRGGVGGGDERRRAAVDHRLGGGDRQH
jgi:hypothetical protein